MEHWNALLSKFYEMAETEKNILYLEDALIVNFYFWKIQDRLLNYLLT